MDFSEIISNVQNAIFSADGNLTALTNGTKVIIKNTSQLHTIQTYSFPDLISHMEFSPDSHYLLVVMSKRNQVEARAVYEEEWACKIEDPLLGILYARWAPDSRHILTFSDYQMRLSVYSLIDKTMQHIKHPKYADKGLCFSSDGKFMALAERKDTKDYIGIYHTGEWKLVNYMQTDTFDLHDLVWSPDNSAILCVDTPLEYKFSVYCPAQGLLQKFQPNEYGLGIKTFKFSSNSMFLAVGSYDEKIRLFNCLSWKVITEFEHKSLLTDLSDTLVFKEEEIKSMFPYKVDSTPQSTKYVMLENTVKLPTVKVATDKPNPQQGIGMLAWSPDGSYIASRNDNMPNVLWIWDVNTLSLKTVLIQLQPIKNFTWCDNSEYLLFCTGAPRVFFWSKEGASVCDIPFESKQFGVQKIEWNQDGATALLFDKSDLVVAYPPPEFLLRPVMNMTIGSVYHNQSQEDEKGEHAFD